MHSWQLCIASPGKKLESYAYIALHSKHKKKEENFVMLGKSTGLQSFLQKTSQKLCDFFRSVEK